MTFNVKNAHIMSQKFEMDIELALGQTIVDFDFSFIIFLVKQEGLKKIGLFSIFCNTKYLHSLRK